MAVVGGKGYQRNQVEDRFTAAIAAREQVSNVLRMPKRFGGDLGKEDREFDVRRHMLHIDDHCIEHAQIGIPLHYRHQGGRVGKFILDADRHQRKLENQGRSHRGQYLDRWRDLPRVEGNTLTVGAICPGLPKSGARSCGGVVGNVSVPPVLLGAVGVWLGACVEGMLHALRHMASSKSSDSRLEARTRQAATLDKLWIRMTLFLS